MNIAQAAKLAIEQVFALAGAEQAPRDHDLAFGENLRLEFAAADLQDHGAGAVLRGFGVGFGRWLAGRGTALYIFSRDSK